MRSFFLFGMSNGHCQTNLNRPAKVRLTMPYNRTSVGTKVVVTAKSFGAPYTVARNVDGFSDSVFTQNN